MAAFGKLNDLRAISLEPLEERDLGNMDPSKSSTNLAKSAKGGVEFYHSASGEIVNIYTLNVDDVRWLLRASEVWHKASWWESILRSMEG